MTSSATLERVYTLSAEGLDEAGIARRTGIPLSRVGVILDELAAGAERPESGGGTTLLLEPAPAAPAGLTFEEPPPTRRGTHGNRRSTDEVLAALRARPGEWARLPGEHPPSTASWWRKHHGCDARAAKQPSGRYVIYLRWPS